MIQQQNHQIFEQVQAPIMRSIHPRGIIWVGAAALLAFIAMLAGWDIAGLLLLIAGIFYICFRDPQRVMPVAENIAVAPADGILTRIDRAPWPAEAHEDGDATRLVINPRFYDAHILRAAAASTLTVVQHVIGQWGSNIFDKTSSGNERAVFISKLPDNRMLALEVIGGAMAERFHLSARAGDMLTLGQPVGYSVFGGEVHLYLPVGVEVIAQPGQHMIAGETAIAALDASAAGYEDVSNDDAYAEMSSNDTGVLPNSAGFQL